jgi:arsenite oxidase small subunit
MERRGFIKFCAAGAAGAATQASFIPPVIAADARPQLYSRARLVDEKGKPLRAKAIPPNRNLIFHYPYASTPCFLLNLGKPAKGSAQLKTADNQPYEWKGGVGPGRSVVAYSAICAHKLTYPTRDISFISFRPEKSAGNKLGAVIHCCSEHSQYDPAEGARVLAGPAPQPLAAILLEHHPATDEIHAVGTLGGELFNEFFSKYEFKLAMEHGGAARRAVADSCVVQELDHYCRQQVKC